MYIETLHLVRIMEHQSNGYHLTSAYIHYLYVSSLLNSLHTHVNDGIFKSTGTLHVCNN